MKRFVKVGIIVVVFLLVGLILNGQVPNQQGFEIMKNLDIYSTLIKELNQDYVDDINPGDLAEIGIDAMLESLDPYTNYIPES